MSLIPFAGAVQKFNRSGGGGAAGYQIERSLRFNSADTAYLSKTFGTTGDQQKWTWSAWVKGYFVRASGSFALFEISNGVDGADTNGIRFTAAGKINYICQGSGVGTSDLISTAVYRDPSAWYHIVVAVDTTQATDTNRIKIYVNGVQVTAFDTAIYQAQDSNTLINTTSYAHDIGRISYTSPNFYYNGYMTEVHFVNAQQLSPTDFGEFNEDTGVWQPKAYTGSYGTNGFYLNFSDNASTTTLGDDLSGNGNDWTTNGVSVTAGAGNDSLVDTPTPYGTDTGAGGEVRGNYATLNPLTNTGIGTLSEGNLQLVTSTNSKTITATMALPSSGQYYFEITATDYVTDGGTFFGLVNNSFLTGAPSNGTFLGFNTYSGSYNNGTSTDTNGLTGTNVTQDGDIWCIAVDMTNSKFWIGRSRAGSLTWADGTTPAVNGSGATTLALPSGTLYPMAYRGGSFNETYNFNFGQRAFAHTAPSGFKALCTQNLPEPTIVDGAKYFGTLTWNGDDTARTITSGSSGVDGEVDFTPGFTWIKRDNGATNGSDHLLLDVVRGVGTFNGLSTNGTEAEGFTPAGSSWQNFGDIQSFVTNGFTVQKGTDPSHTYEAVNETGGSYVAWNWKAGNSNVTNTDGSITSTVSANTDSGFSIVTYTGNGVDGSTVGHGLGQEPAMLIVKSRNTDPTGWGVWHTSLSGITYYLALNTTAAQAGPDNVFTGISSTTFTLGDDGWSNVNTRTYVAYCFAAIPGYSAFGSYTGNGSTDGPFQYLGFRPAFLLIKMSSSTENWAIWDNRRDGYNKTQKFLLPSLSSAEQDGPQGMDFLSNGFKLRADNALVNTNAATYIYAAFSEAAFKYSLGR